MNTARPRRTSIAAGWLFIVVIWLVFFGPVMAGRQQFGFRDTASMYFPLFQWIDRQWQEGTLPSWNPLDDFGMSVIGDTSSSLFYPVKLLFFLPVPSFELQFAWYVAGHVLLAAAGAWWAARTMGCGVAAATLAAISYAFGGAVVFQTCNLIYLVGAAWLPAALACTWNFCRRGDWRWLTGSAITLAMMVLGGDPQMALMGGLILVFLIATTPGSIRPLSRLAAPLLLAGVALALSAVQLWPAVHWARRSERMVTDPPVTLASAIQTGDYRGLVSEPVAGSHASAMYEFSFAPWRIVELLWPNVAGDFDFVSETNPSSILPGADRLWTPSIYLGVLVALLAFGERRFRRGSADDTSVSWQLTWLAVFFLVASFGWYGIGWLVNELQLMRGGTGLGALPGRPVGGLYWVLVSLLPGFSTFRYPAKLVVVAGLAVCLLGGLGLQRWAGAERPGARPALAALSGNIRVVLLAGLPVALLAAGGWLAARAGWAGDALPWTWAGDVLLAIGQSTAVLMTAASAIFLTASRPTRSLAWFMVGLTAVDLTLANYRLQGFVPGDPAAKSASKLRDSLYRNPAALRYELDPARSITLAELQAVDRLSLYPRYHLPPGKRLTGSFMSIEPLDVLLWKRAVAGLNDRDRKMVLGASGVQQIIDSVSWSHENPVGSGPQVPADQRVTVRLAYRDLESVESFWLADQWHVLPEIDNHDWSGVVRRTREVLAWIAEQGLTIPILESSESRLPHAVPDDDGAGFSGTLQLLIDQATHKVLEVDVPRECLLVGCQYFDSGWQATIGTNGGSARSVSLIRANRLLTAMHLPRGQHRIELIYRPPGLVRGAMISGLAWLILGIWTSAIPVRRLVRGRSG